MGEFMKQVGRYQIIRELGRGGMAVVYRAYDPQVERPVAIKVMAAHSLHNEESRKRFEREARVIGSLQHPAIVPLYDFGEENGQPYLVMSLMRGGSLSDHLRRGLFSLDEAARLILRLAPALDLAHERGIVHRDLKPDNILFDQQDNPYITDFGIAKLFNSTSELSQSGIVIGSVAYMSPEQATGKDIDGRSDIYSLGVILFQILTGRRPFESNNSLGFMYQHLNDPVPSICTIRNDLPLGCEVVIARAMAKNPNHRYATASEMATALMAVAADLPPDAISESRLRTKPLTPREAVTRIVTRSWWEKRVVWVSVALFSTALIIALVLIITMPSDIPDSAPPVPSTELLYRVVNVQNDDVLNVRSEPSGDASLVGRIPPNGAGVQITGANVQVDGAVWVRIQYGEMKGWVNRQFLIEQSLLYRVVNVEDDDVLNVRAGPGTSESKVGTIPPNGTDIQITGSTVEADGGVWVPIKYIEINGWVNRHFLIKQSWLFRVVNVEDYDVLNVRSGAGIEHSLQGTVPPDGTDIQIIGTSVEADGGVWVPIKYGELTGWVNRYFLTEQK